MHLGRSADIVQDRSTRHSTGHSTDIVQVIVQDHGAHHSAEHSAALWHMGCAVHTPYAQYIIVCYYTSSILYTVQHLFLI